MSCGIAVVRQKARTLAWLDKAGAGSDVAEMERACDEVETVGLGKGRVAVGLTFLARAGFGSDVAEMERAGDEVEASDLDKR